MLAVIIGLTPASSRVSPRHHRRNTTSILIQWIVTKRFHQYFLKVERSKARTIAFLPSIRDFGSRVRKFFCAKNTQKSSYATIPVCAEWPTCRENMANDKQTKKSRGKCCITVKNAMKIQNFALLGKTSIWSGDLKKNVGLTLLSDSSYPHRKAAKLAYMIASLYFGYSCQGLCVWPMLPVSFKFL